MGVKIVSAALLIFAVAGAGAAQTVRDGVSAWQRGDPAAAVAAWTPLAARGDADAAFNLAQAYRLGKGVPVNLPVAQGLLEQAARKGHVDAATTLGILLFQNGNRTGAMRWLRQAAEASEPRAMLLYGTALYNGDGVAADPVRAYAFVSRAAAQGLAAGRESLRELDAMMPLDQRQKGVALAKAMVAAKPATKAGATAANASKSAAPPVALRAARANPAPTLSASPAGSGGWRIQLGAFAQRATAEALFAKLRGKLAPHQAYYVPAGSVIRLQAGPYDSRAAASAACAGLGQACFAVAAR